MFLALTDHLRCTAAHADSWLVARADRVESGRMVNGALGCPVCRAEREVRGGVVRWTAGPADPAEPAPDHQAARELAGDDLARIGALLAFGESHLPFVLTGPASRAAPGLLGLADASLVLLDPPDDGAATLTTIIRGAPQIPLGAGTARGILLDGPWATDSRARRAAGLLVNGGRLVAPMSVAVPAGVRELARDEGQWVAERVAGAVPVSIRRAPVHPQAPALPEPDGDAPNPDT